MPGSRKHFLAPQTVPNWNQIAVELTRLAAIARTLPTDLPELGVGAVAKTGNTVARTGNT